MMAINAALSKARKKRAVADSVAGPEDIAGYTLLGSHALHSARGGAINDIDLHPKQVGLGRGRAVGVGAGNWGCGAEVAAKGWLLVGACGQARHATPTAAVAARPQAAPAAVTGRSRRWRAPMPP
jgi:hypothetical protein